ncbi:MAG: glycosyltransferase family 2 protein, partial [Actinomycetia bacterium]|nr:glycosyltransferase family 2 protein [Actinomycetes bacterium]
MSTPQISVVVIFLNEEQFLAEAIESVFAQTFADWELILVDDGSSDGSVEAARLACEERPHQVRLLQHPGCANMGMSASRNLGIGHCRGEWISFLDGDDVWLPQKLERQVAVSEETPGVDIVVSPAKLWRTWSTDSNDAVDDVQRFRVEAGMIADPPTLVEGFLDDEMTSVCDLLARRSVVEQVGGYETEFTGMFEDQVFHVKLLRNRSAAVT